MAGELFKMMAGVDLVARALSRHACFPDLLGGQVQVTFSHHTVVARFH